MDQFPINTQPYGPSWHSGKGGGGGNLKGTLMALVLGLTTGVKPLRDLVSCTWHVKQRLPQNYRVMHIHWLFGSATSSSLTTLGAHAAVTCILHTWGAIAAHADTQAAAILTTLAGVSTLALGTTVTLLCGTETSRAVK